MLPDPEEIKPTTYWSPVGCPSDSTLRPTRLYSLEAPHQSASNEYLATDKAIFVIQKMPISFLFLNKNICCGYSLEAPQQGASNEYPQHMFSSRNKKNIMWIHPLICSYAQICFPGKFRKNIYFIALLSGDMQKRYDTDCNKITTYNPVYLISSWNIVSISWILPALVISPVWIICKAFRP